MTVGDLGTDTLNRARSRFFASETERKSKAECKRNHDAREECLHELGRNTKLVEDCEDSGDPDRIFCDCTREVT